MRCIICLEGNKLPSAEHIFPYAIGGSLVTERVCVECNSILGRKIDPLLIDHPLVLVQRDSLGLKGHSGTVPFALERILDEVHLASDRGQRMKWTRTKDGLIQPELIYKRAQDNDRITITVDERSEKSLSNIIQRERKRAGGAPLTEPELSSLVSRIVSNVQEIEKPVIAGVVAIDTFAYQKAVLKVVYELGHYWLGDQYLDDATAANIRQAFTTDVDVYSLRIKGQIAFGLLEPLNLWEGQNEKHCAFCISSGGLIVIGLKVFGVISALIVASLQADRYMVPESDGYFVSLCTTTRSNKPTSFSNACLEAIAAHQRAGLRRWLLSTVSHRSMMQF